MKRDYYYYPYISISPQTTHDLQFTKFTPSVGWWEMLTEYKMF